MADSKLDYQHYSGGAGAASPLRREAEAKVLDKPKSINPRLVSLLRPNTVEAERYRRLRHKVEKIQPAHGGVVVGLTSPVAGDGKTLTSLNLAGALSQDPRARVLLVELDLRHPYTTVADYLGIAGRVKAGVTEHLEDGVPSASARYAIPDYNLHVMPAGRKSEAPYEALKSPRLGRLIEEARGLYDYVVVDTPPVALLPDSQLVSPWVDAFLLVVAARKTPRKMLEEALSLMEADKVMGLVFNGYTTKSEKYYGYY